jgi:hypothetical protein
MRLHPKCLVVTTQEVLAGAPILTVFHSPLGEAEKDAEIAAMFGTGGGELSGVGFLHTYDAALSEEEFDPYFFAQIPELDGATKAVLAGIKPGFYRRESAAAPYEFEAPEDDGE